MLAYAAKGDFNLKTAPISDFIGIANIEAEYAFSDKMTVGPSFSRFDLEVSDITYENTLYGVRFNYYLHQALESSWLIGISALFGDFDISEKRESDALTFSTSTSVRIYTAMFSYQAMWSNFNMAFGLGYTYISLPETVIATNDIETVSLDTSFLSGGLPNAEITLGWRF